VVERREKSGALTGKDAIDGVLEHRPRVAAVAWRSRVEGRGGGAGTSVTTARRISQLGRFA
jgi:hypothetical protein